MPDHAHSTSPPLDRRGRGARRVAWAGARARNALRRHAQLGVVAAVVFAATLITLILVPQQAQRAFAALQPRPEEWQDTTRILQQVDRARDELTAARGVLASARAAATAPPPAPLRPVATLTAEQIRFRDSLEAEAEQLRRGLQRLERAPLPATYRALGELPEVAVVPRTRLLLDSLAAVEREREEFAALGGVDPIVVALATRATAIGREIQAIAEGRLAGTLRELEALAAPPPPPPAAPRPEVDTLGPLTRVVDAEARLAATEEALTAAREANERLAARAERAREGANFIAPPLAVLAAAAILALAVGYAAALLAELRRPRVADGEEIERETRVRTLAVVRAGGSTPERARRRADVRTPDLLDPLAEPYRMLNLQLSPTGAALPIVTVTGDEPAIVATVAANLAASTAEDARSVLLIDADLATGAIASIVRSRPVPGISELLRGEAGWSDTLSSALFGRERTVDVIPAGTPVPRLREPVPSDAFRMDLHRLARRYDLTVLATSLAHACRGSQSILPAPDVVLCVQSNATSLVDLRGSVAALHGAGLRVQGVVLWDMPVPTVRPFSVEEWEERSGRVVATGV